MDVLIIGGSRFVGPILVEKLLAKGHNVTLFNRGTIRSDYGPGIRFIKGDRNSGFGIKDHFDAVFDMCAFTGEQTRRALSELDADHFIHFSSAAVYERTDRLPITEKSPIGAWPLWGEYNRGKVECERTLEESGKKYASLRPVYILGPGDYCGREEFIYARLMNGLPLVLPGDGMAKVQFVFAKDVAESFMVLTEKGLEGAYNCVGDDEITLKGLVEEMGRICEEDPIIDFNPLADGEGFDIGQFPFANEEFRFSNAKLRAEGMRFTPLAEGLEEDFDEYYSMSV
ncbi:TPA: NAD-dependent epimerase/dehydratase family protein [Candidatus Micrarchaeota archaeon]|nr:NAD-dependent epimerase/dehydratase family protein [Candidatus Micrarchaeota archaeon]